MDASIHLRLGSTVTFHQSGGFRAEGIIVGRTLEERPRYDIRVETTIYANIPLSAIVAKEEV